MMLLLFPYTSNVICIGNVRKERGVGVGGKWIGAEEEMNMRTLDRNGVGGRGYVGEGRG